MCGVSILQFARKRLLFRSSAVLHPDNLPKALQRFQGDGETGLSLKIASSGLKAVYHPRAAVQHEVPVSRLTVQHFEQHAYYQGVCNSYTEIRTAGRFMQPTPSWKDPLRRIKRSLRGAAHGVKLSKVQRQVADAYVAGYCFHQEEVRKDPKLLEWVLRRDYWDYRLPEGWERY